MFIAVAILVTRVEPHGTSAILDVAVVQGPANLQECTAQALKHAIQRYPREHGYCSHQVRSCEVPFEYIQSDGWVRAETQSLSNEIVIFLGQEGTQGGKSDAS